MDGKFTNLTNLSDSDFLNFLYSERDREKSLSEKNGWTNWAIAGAMITVIYSLYVTLRNINLVDWEQVLLYSSGSLALISVLITFLKAFNRKRGATYNKVKFIKDVIPWIDFLSILFANIILAFLSTKYCKITTITYLWILLLCLHVVAITISCFIQNRVVPANYTSAYFPWYYPDLIVFALTGGVLGLIFHLSYRMVSWDIFNVYFEIGLYLSGGFTLFFLLIKHNCHDKQIRYMDAIIDNYLYANISKENICMQLRRCSIGYDVIEVCYNELKELSMAMQQAESMEKLLSQLKESLFIQKDSLNHLISTTNKLNEILKCHKHAIKLSRKLSRRLSQIESILGENEANDELMYIYKKNLEIYDKIEIQCIQVDEISKYIQEEINKYYCKRYLGICERECAQRNGKPSFGYLLKMRSKRLFRIK